VAEAGTSKAGGTISQQAAVHPWLAADAHASKQTNKQHQGTQVNEKVNYSKILAANVVQNYCVLG
jgi:hypothetical protein